MTVENPKNPGDRAYGHGDQISVKAEDGFDKGDIAELNGDGSIGDPETDDDGGADAEYVNPDDLVIVKSSADAGEGTTIHLRGAIRGISVLEDGDDNTVHPFPVVREYDVDGSALYVVR